MNKKGFTLIELLAVIIILGILMIIAIPSVTKYISDSRKSSYVDTAKEVIGSARNLVNSGSLEMYDTDATYYIESSCIKTENDLTSPYGKFTKAYVVVIYDGKGYTYYWTSVDDAGQGIKDIIRFDKLDTENIESDLKDDDISTLRGIDGRSKTIVVSKGNNCQKEGSNATDSQVDGETGNELVFAAKTIKNTNQLVYNADAQRYIGSNPNNYVRFNGNELWRIIGVYGNNLKIIRDSKITNKKYHNGSLNDWAGSSLASYLNEEYYNSLNQLAKDMIITSKWYVGKITNNENASFAYEGANEIEWNGKVGLISTYEYLYAATEDCYSIHGGDYKNSCAAKDWIFKNNNNSSWTINPTNTASYYSLIIWDNGNVSTSSINGEQEIYPVVYLKSSVKITGGDGTSSDPYTLGL